ncbi:hypothetical protein [Faecalibacterium prausnitzii]|uniref:hypothetical protein n=1 Tax=Faecalibacterium prausnitzii TaxID=853 RepID=UPI0035689666
MSSLQHLSFSGCCGNATRKGEQRAARNPPFRYKNSGTRHFWRAPLGLIRILHPNHITGSIRCHLNPYQSVDGRSCLLHGITRRVKPSYTVHHRVKQSALIFDIFSLNLTFGSQNVKLISIFGRIL